MLNEIQIRQFRNIEEASLTFGDGITLLSGDNGSGKTSIAEAVFLMFRGRSFRTNRWRSLVKEGCNGFALSGSLSGRFSKHRLVIKREGANRDIRLNGRSDVKVAEIVATKPVLFLGPQAGNLVTGKPETRRRWLDFLMFHVKHDQRGIWARYRRALSQRNAALRSSASDKVIEVLDKELAAVGEQLSIQRRLVVGEIDRLFDDRLISRFELGKSEVGLRQGWSEDLSFEEALRQSLESDRKMGFTHVGPHRADVQITFSGRSVRERLSRGQSKLLACSLLLAQLKALDGHSDSSPFLLVDDIAAELDEDARSCVLSWLSDHKIQTLITCLPNDEISSTERVERMFHVEQGRCSAVI